MQDSIAFIIIVVVVILIYHFSERFCRKQYINRRGRWSLLCTYSHSRVRAYIIYVEGEQKGRVIFWHQHDSVLGLISFYSDFSRPAFW